MIKYDAPDVHINKKSKINKNHSGMFFMEI